MVFLWDGRPHERGIGKSYSHVTWRVRAAKFILVGCILYPDFGSDEETDVDVFVELTRRIYTYKEAVFFALSLFRMVENIFDFS